MSTDSVWVAADSPMTALARPSPATGAPSRRTVSVLVRPSRMAIVRSTNAAIAGSCVTMMTVKPAARLSSRRSAKVDAAVPQARSPVGCARDSGGGNRGEGWGVARARRTGEGDHFPLMHFEGEALQRDDLEIGHRINLDQVVTGHECHGRSS